MQRLIFFFLVFLITLSAKAVQQIATDTVLVSTPIVDSIQKTELVKRDSIIRPYRSRYIDKDSICYAKMTQVMLADNTIFRKKFFENYPTDSFLFKEVPVKLILNESTVDFKKVIIRPDRPDWVIYLLFFILSFFAMIKYRYGKYIDTIIEAFFNGRTINQLIRDDDFFKSRPSILLFFLTSFAGGLLYYDIIYYFNEDLNPPRFLTFVKGMLLIASLVLVKVLLLRFLGFIFSINKIIKSYITIIYSATYFFVIISLPLLVLFAVLPTTYLSIIISLLIMLASLNILLHYIRGSFFVISNFQFPKFYLFIYLCALELSPLLILIKVLS